MFSARLVGPPIRLLRHKLRDRGILKKIQTAWWFGFFYVSLQHPMIKERYNVDIARCLNDSRPGRHVAMGMNADATTLIKLMDIGTPTNISKNQ